LKNKPYIDDNSFVIYELPSGAKKEAGTFLGLFPEV
jgi:hypothetical protein